MSTAPGSTSQLPATPVPYDPELEIRYAVVMYGGVSLAIYINGVAQELLDMVAATAPARPDATKETTERLLPTPERPLRGAQRVYRKIAQNLWDYRRGVRPAGGAKDDDTIRVRFVVDVISGTSAGGINGIFLAKALANDESMQGLRQLWLNEGDLSRLLNDGESIRDLPGLSVARPQASLLNSQRMYHILLSALDSMERAGTRRATPREFTPTPLVHELDLFITTTDIRGLVQPIKLADAAVWEPRHRNVFHFRYEIAGATGADWNDFVKPNDPFLAFTARCTSSFPFAFEPMRLEAVPEVARHFSLNDHPYNRTDIGSADWEHFYSEYLGVPPGPPKTRDELKAEFAQRSFGDGGYLDNKPFSHATSMLLRRHANVPVERKLIYVEPAPEHPENKEVEHTEINFLDNIMAALGDLPRAETIREDLDRLTDRNRLIRRVRQYLGDAERNLSEILREKSLDRRKFQYRFPVDVVGDWGPAYAAYHRLKIDSISSLLSDRVARAADIDPASDGCLAVKALIVAWRRNRFTERPDDPALPRAERRATENRFLRLYDVPYALRRLYFAMTRINELAALGRSDDGKSARAEELLRNWAVARDVPAPARAKGPKAKRAAPFDLAAALANESWLREFREELRTTKRLLAGYLSTTRRCVEELGSKRAVEAGQPDHAGTLRLLVGQLGLTPEENAKLLSLPEGPRTDYAETIVATREKRFVAIAAFIAWRFRSSRTPPIAKKSDKTCKTAGAVARECLQFYYNHFFVYDMIAFPMQHGTESGETSEVEVYRVSPEDANQLVVEGASGRKKLAGTVLMNFGAFLERSWRTNDILWGRLDGSERLICSILPGEAASAIRRELIGEAHDAILREDLSADEAESLTRAFMQKLLTQKPDATSGEIERAVREMAGAPDLSRATAAIMRSCLTPERIRAHFCSPRYAVPPLDPNQAARTVTRAVNIIGEMLTRLGQEQLSVAGRWLARFGRFCWLLVEAASPQSLRNIFLRHWATLLLICALLLVAAGMAFSNGDVAHIGWLVLAAALVCFFAVALLRDVFARRTRLLTVAVAGLGLLLLVALAIGLRDVYQWAMAMVAPGAPPVP